MKIVLAQNNKGSKICFRPGNRGDLAQPLMDLIQLRFVEGWYKNNPSAMSFVKKIIDAWYKNEPLIIEGEPVTDPDFEGLALDFIESRSQFAKESVEILETEN